MLDSDVYVKTDAGRDEIRSRALGLPMAARAILLMVDGQRTVSSMRTLIAGSKAPADVLDALVAQGLIEPRAGVPLAAPVSAPVPAPAPPVAAPPTAAIGLHAPQFVADPTRSTTPAHDGPLDLVLPTIHAPEASPATTPAPTPVAVPQTAGAAPVANRYEHLYAMMNEIVRDFLAPHRRYFFQLKIERATTAEELLELLHDLQTALSKARGDAFASDVIARLRAAAG